MKAARPRAWCWPSESPESQLRLTRLPQHRHEFGQTVEPRPRDHLRAVPAPVQVALDAVRLPADVLQVLDAEAPNSPTTRPQRGQG